MFEDQYVDELKEHFQFYYNKIKLIKMLLLT